MSLRIKAFLVHLTGSITLAGFVLVLVFLYWYPSPLAQALGVTHIFLLMLGIDVIIGPLLTLFVFKQGKKTLKFDLAVILIVQLSMFSYGIHTVAQGRPVWLAFSVDQFYTVRAADISAQSLKEAAPEYQSIPLFGPQWVAIRLPDDRKKREHIISETLDSGSGLFYSPSLYAPLESATKEILANAKPISTLKQWNTPQAIHAALAQSPTTTAWLPLWNDHQLLTVFINKEGQIVSITDLHPQ